MSQQQQPKVIEQKVQARSASRPKVYRVITREPQRQRQIDPGR